MDPVSVSLLLVEDAHDLALARTTFLFCEENYPVLSVSVSYYVAAHFCAQRLWNLFSGDCRQLCSLETRSPSVIENRAQIFILNASILSSRHAELMNDSVITLPF